MNIYEYIPGRRLPIGKTAAALGFFDGVHIGHRRLLMRARALSESLGLEFTVFTFPSESNGFKGVSPLYKSSDKLLLLESLGVRNVIYARLSDIADISALDFIKSSLAGDMNCRAAVVGDDFRFGRDRGGDAELLKSTLCELGAVCEIESEVRLGGERVSSTRIRKLLLDGDAEGAHKLLGLPYFITSEVRSGRGVGRVLGFPTVNISFEDFTPPLKRGVYRTVTDIGGRCCNSITNVGVCPTFDKREAHIETHLIDFSGDLYGKEIRTFFLGFLRDEMRFNNEKELIMQINVDKNTTIQKNGEILWQEIGQNLR